jgi:hypothetical protein
MKTTLIMIAFLSSSERRNMVQSQGRFQWYIVRTFERYMALSQGSLSLQVQQRLLWEHLWKEGAERSNNNDVAGCCENNEVFPSLRTGVSLPLCQLWNVIVLVTCERRHCMP